MTSDKPQAVASDALLDRLAFELARQFALGELTYHASDKLTAQQMNGKAMAWAHKNVEQFKARAAEFMSNTTGLGTTHKTEE